MFRADRIACMIKCFIIVATTVDGFIAEETSQVSTKWTSGADKSHFQEVSKRAGVIVMGLTTYKTIGKPLPERLNIVYAQKGTPLIEGVEMTDKSPEELLQDLEARGFKEVAICGGSSIYTMFMKSGLVEEIYITLEPRLFGSGIKLFNDKVSAKLSMIESKQLSPDVLLLHYKVLK